MEEMIRCPHCLSQIKAGERYCHFCDKSLQNTNPPGTLPFAFLLAGCYTVGRHLASDGEGVVYEAVENNSGVRVLIKEYFPVTLSDGRDEQGLVLPKEGREVLFKTTRMDFADLYRSIMRITPATGLAAVLDVVEQNNTVYAVLEQLEGETLEHYLSEHAQSMNPAQARSLMQPIMEGAAAMHKAGLVHRGISPQNIIITLGGSTRLSGYATLGLRTEGSELKSCLYDGYSAPEQYSAAEFEGRYTDVYGLAAVFYRLLTAQTPVPAPQRHVTDSMLPARTLEPEVPGYISAVLLSAMRMDPSSRIQNVPELMGALISQRAADTITKSPKEEEKEETEKKEYISTKTLFAGSLIIIFILSLLLVWSLLARGSKEPPTSVSNSVSVEQNTEVLTVPDVVGVPYTQVQSDSKYNAKFRFVLAGQEHSSEYDKGVIIQQDPQEGTNTTDPRPLISVVVSMGPELVEMPNIQGFPQEDAQRELEKKHIKASFSMIENNGEYASGCVAYTDPVPETEIDVGSITVNVYIAKDRDIPQVPDPTEVPVPTPDPPPQQTPSAAPTATPPASVSQGQE